MCQDLVPRSRIELLTPGSSDLRSTTELPRQGINETKTLDNQTITAESGINLSESLPEFNFSLG